MTTVFSLLVAVVLLMAMRAGAAWVRPPGAIADLDGCGLPCWRGIISGETMLEDAQARLNGDGYQQLPVSRFFTNPITYAKDDPSECQVRLAFNVGLVDDVVLNSCPAVRLGDVMPMLGQPDGFVAPHILSFRGATVFVEIVGRRTCDTPFSPLTRVENIFIMPATFPINSRTQSVNLERLAQWQGFMGGAHYIAREQRGTC